MRSAQDCLVRSAALALALAVAPPALAVPVSVSFLDDPAHCDPLTVPGSLDELGLGVASGGPFPANEEVLASTGITFTSGCPASDTGNFNWTVSLTNLTGQDFTDVWYVADPETTIANWDGWVNGELAFRIDAVGANTPLIGESLTPDGIFEAGELWTFVLDDYSNGLSFSADALLSIGVGSSSIGLDGSSGSIIAVASIPEPSTLALLAGALAALVGFRGRPATRHR